MHSVCNFFIIFKIYFSQKRCFKSSSSDQFQFIVTHLIFPDCASDKENINVINAHNIINFTNHNGALGMTVRTIRTPKPPIAVVQNGADEKQLQGQEEIMHMDENGVDAEINHDQNENQPKNGNDHADSVLLWC